MTAAVHLPALRAGRPYESLDTVELRDHRSTGDADAIVTVSQIGAGMIRRDMKRADERAAVLRAIPMRELLERCTAAARVFLEDTLSTGIDGSEQSPDDYVVSLSQTSGMPHTLCRANMQKVATVMCEMPTILRGLMRGMDPTVLDTGVGEHDGVPVWYTPTTNSLGAVLPSNSPGVHSLWVPSIALKVPVVLKPGREEPWTPMRIAQAMIAAGIPSEAFSLYPTDHEGAATVLDACGRALLFGDAKTTAKYAADPSIEIHGPGRSKVLLGADEVERWRDHLDVLVASVSDNGGRSCINASAIFVPSHGEEIATALAERLAEVVPVAHDDDGARLAAFANPAFAEAMNAAIEHGLGAGGARDTTASIRGVRGGSVDRLCEFGGATYLLPTVVYCDSVDHALANTEYLFPFTSVVEVPEERMLETIGPSLVVTAITKSESFLSALRTSGDIHRLNLGPIPTSRVEWDQPHEGNLFEFLYTRRALQERTDW